jgi:hypothetical protein
VRLAAEQQGLQRALELFPDMVKAAYERGTAPLGAFPKGTPPLIGPAPVFDPTRFEDGE